ncbi:MAG: TIR domain-containing protein, partial [Gammaproteobacteria bacterium]
MASVFINYRSEAAAWAVVLDRELSERFGVDRVFRAPRSIRPSEDFIDRILQGVRSSSVLLAVIGPTWLAVDTYNRR